MSLKSRHRFWCPQLAIGFCSTSNGLDGTHLDWCCSKTTKTQESHAAKWCKMHWNENRRYKRERMSFNLKCFLLLVWPAPNKHSWTLTVQFPDVLQAYSMWTSQWCQVPPAMNPAALTPLLVPGKSNQAITSEKRKSDLTGMACASPKDGPEVAEYAGSNRTENSI